MKKVNFAYWGFCVLLSFYSCAGNSQRIIGKGEVITDKRTVGSFTGVNLEFSGDVMIKQGNETSVDVVTQANIAQEVETVVEDNILHVRFKKRQGYNDYSTKKLTVYVVSPTIENLSLTGSGELTALSDIKSSNLKVLLKGSGNLKLQNIDCTALEARLQGSGNVSMSGGTAVSAVYELTGSGDLIAEKVKSRSVSASLKGSGNISCTATDAIDAKATGSGDIAYYGHPAQTIVKSSGSGNVTSH